MQTQKSTVPGRNCPVVIPYEASMKVYWGKIGGSYRQAMFDMYYPVQGLALYDTWIPTENYGNRFYDFNSDTADSHGIGAHLGNEFQMVAKNLYLSGNTFINTDREIQFGRCGSNQVEGPELFF